MPVILGPTLYKWRPQGPQSANLGAATEFRTISLLSTGSSYTQTGLQQDHVFRFFSHFILDYKQMLSAKCV